MIRKNNQPIVNVYLNGHQINEIYSGGFRVYPDQVVDQTFWLKAIQDDNSVVYCYCRLLNEEKDTQQYLQSYELLEEIHPASGTVVTSINTGYTPISTTNIECRYKCLKKVKGNPRLFSSSGSWNNAGTIAVDYESSNVLQVHFNGQSASWTTSTLAYDTQNIYTIYYSRNSVSLLEPEQITLCSYSGSGWTTSTPIYIAQRNNSDANEQGNYNYYYMKIYEGNTLVHEYKPAKRISDNKYGFYDTVTENFLYATTTGQFTGTSKETPEYAGSPNPNYNKTTAIYYQVIQTQSTAPDSDYYELTKEIYIADSSTDYTSVLTTNGMDPDEIYDIIPQINQKLIIEDTRYSKWSKGLQLNGFNDWSLGLDVHDYDEFRLTAQVSKYEGDGLFGCNSSNDNMDFRLFLYPSANIAFDCGSGRAQYTSFSSAYAYKIWTAYMRSGQQFYIEQTLNGTTNTYNSNTSLNFANYTGDSELKLCPTVSWQSAQYEPFVFYELQCLNNGVLLHDFVIYEDDLSLSSTNRLYDTVTKQFLTHPSLTFNLVNNQYGISGGDVVYCKGNILNDFSLDSTMYNQEINKTTYYYNNILVSDSLNNMDYETGAKYVDHVVYQTANPTIFYDSATFRVQAYGDGTVKLYVNNTEVSNPYTFTQNASNTSYTVSATAKEDGKAISDTVTQSITVPGYKTDTPVISFNSSTFVVQASGNGTVLLYVDGAQVSNPYTLYQENSSTTYMVTATAQESGKQISDTASKSCTVPAYQAIAPTISFNKHTGVVSASGNGTVILYIDGTQVSNPYTLPDYGTYTATATSQETGRPISDTTTLSIEYVEIISEAFINFNKVDTSYKAITNVVLDNTTILTCRYYRTTDGKTASLFGCSDNTGGSWERSVKSCVYRDTHLYFGGAGLSYSVNNNEPHTIIVSYQDGTITVDGTQVYSGMIISNNTCAKFGLSFFYHMGSNPIDGSTSNGQFIHSFEYKHGNDVYLVEVDNDGLVTHTLNGIVQKSVQTTVDYLV